MNDKISVYGSTGFIGTYFCKYFINTIQIPREQDKPESNEILYLISTTDNYNVFTDLKKDIDTNLTKLMSILKHCKKNNLVFNMVSSWFVYGNQDKLPVNESTICNPTGFYSITKKCAEDMLISFCKTFDVKYRILRLCNVYGTGDKFSEKKNALQYLIEEMKLNNDIYLYHDGQFIRDYMHIFDVCKAIKLVIDKAPHNCIINIGSGIPQNFREIITLAHGNLKSTSSINPIDPPEFHKIVQTKDMFLDTSFLRSLGFKQKIAIKYGISELCQRI